MRVFTALALLLLISVAELSAQDRRLSIRVEDLGCHHSQRRDHRDGGLDLLAEQNADARGIAIVTVRNVPAVKLIVTAPGFATEEMEVAIPPRVPTHQVTVSMKLANIQSDVTVSATEQTAEAGGLTQTLSQDEIDQLPDDEEELRRMLEEIAGPGAMIRVDGPSGRRPTRDQIARIVVRRDAFSAEFHQVGQGRVEIATRPGIDRWRGNAGLNLRPSQPSARNAAARAGAKPGTMVRVNALRPVRWCVIASRSRAASKARHPKTAAASRR